MIYYNSCHAPVAQLDRVLGYEPNGREFESLRVHHKSKRVDSFHSFFISAPIKKTTSVTFAIKAVQLIYAHYSVASLLTNLSGCYYAIYGTPNGTQQNTNLTAFLLSFYFLNFFKRTKKELNFRLVLFWVQNQTVNFYFMFNLCLI